MKNRGVLWFAASGAVALMLAAPYLQAQDTKSSDKIFVKEAIDGSIAEVNYAKLALQKSKDQNVTDFATKMVHDHEKLISEMKPLAIKMGG